MHCHNPECRRYFEPGRSDQKHCCDKCRRRAHQIKRTRKSQGARVYHCENDGCGSKVKLTKRQARYSRKHYGMVLCDECKASASIKRITVGEGIINDPYEDGLFVPGRMSDYSLVCPLG